MTRQTRHSVAMASVVALATLAPAPFAVAFAEGGLPHAMSKATVQQLEADPQSLLRDYSAGGLALSARVRALAITDPSAVAALLTIATAGNDEQKAAIGAGLAEAVSVLTRLDPAAAKAIQQAVAQSGIDILVTAFIAASSLPQAIIGDNGDVNSSSGGPPADFSTYPPPGGPMRRFIFSHAGESGGGATTTTQSSVSPSRNAL